MHIAAPCSFGRMSSNVTDSVSPGSAPRTPIGPVAEFTRVRSSFSRVSDSLCTCPVKQSHVSISMTVPGSTITTGSRSASNDQTCSWRPIFTEVFNISSLLSSQYRVNHLRDEQQSHHYQPRRKGFIGLTPRDSTHFTLR